MRNLPGIYDTLGGYTYFPAHLSCRFFLTMAVSPFFFSRPPAVSLTRSFFSRPSVPPISPPLPSPPYFFFFRADVCLYVCLCLQSSARSRWRRSSGRTPRRRRTPGRSSSRTPRCVWHVTPMRTRGCLGVGLDVLLIESRFCRHCASPDAAERQSAVGVRCGLEKRLPRAPTLRYLKQSSSLCFFPWRAKDPDKSPFQSQDASLILFSVSPHITAERYALHTRCALWFARDLLAKV